MFLLGVLLGSSISVILSYGTIIRLRGVKREWLLAMPLADTKMENLLDRDEIAERYLRYVIPRGSVLHGKVSYGIGIFRMDEKSDDLGAKCRITKFEILFPESSTGIIEIIMREEMICTPDS